MMGGMLTARTMYNCSKVLMTIKVYRLGKLHKVKCVNLTLHDYLVNTS